MRRRPTLVVLGLALAAAASYAACRDRAAPRPSWARDERLLHNGIPSRVELLVPPGGDAAAMLATAWSEFERVGRAVNAFDPASEVGRLNAADKREPVEVGADVAALLALSRAAWEATGGAFDPTTWPLKDLWRRAARSGVPPDPEAEAAARARVGLGRVRPLPDGRVRFDVPDAALDFGGIAKGYAVDRVAGAARAAGVASGLVQCGGEIAAWGRSPDGGPWRIGVRDPLAPGRSLGVVSSAEPLAVSTSGNYEQPVTVGGRQFHHVLDPAAGSPASTTVLGVTVAVLPGDYRNARADALATALTVLGAERGLAVVEATPGVAALFVVRDDAAPGAEPRTRVSSAMAAIYRGEPPR
ncbi:MAG: FAD:protein FMN transferase [Deltaproteobacteria bacterium]|nr:FAD:protein FMN transferase [Deltaproteobacteria bacterium]